MATDADRWTQLGHRTLIRDGRFEGPCLGRIAQGFRNLFVSIGLHLWQQFLVHFGVPASRGLARFPDARVTDEGRSRAEDNLNMLTADDILGATGGG